MTLLASQRDKHREVWTNQNSFATTLLILALDTYETEMLEWSPLTIRQEIQEDFHVNIPPANFDRLMQGIIHLTQPLNFYKSLPDFNETCNVFGGDLASPKLVNPADVTDIAWGITEASLIWPAEEDEPFSEEIIGFIAATLDEEGILVPPDILKLSGVNEELIQRIRMDFSDDPEMFSAIWDMEHQKTEEINLIVFARIEELIKQLKSLSLKVGDAIKAAEKLEKGLLEHRRKAQKL